MKIDSRLMDGIIKTKVIATYNSIFPEDNVDSIEELSKNLKREDVIKFCSFINMHYNSTKFSDWEFNFVNQLLIRQNKSLSEHLILKFNDLKNNTNQIPIVFSIISSLKLIQYALISLDDNSDKICDNQDLAIFKIFLILNQEIADKKKVTLCKDEKYTYKEKYLRSLFPSYIEDSEYLPLKNIITQSIKFRLFFDYIQVNKKLNHLIQTFLKKYGASDWREYLLRIYKLYGSFHSVKDKKLSVDQEYNIIKIDMKQFPEEFNYIQTLTINSHINEFNNLDENQKRDYYLIRKYPFYKDNDENYILLNINFLADYVFQNIYFEFRDLIKTHFGDSDSNKFKSIYSYEYSHKILLHKTLDNCFNDKEYLKIPGDNYKNEEYSDYYVRNKKKIFLFEFKDYLLSGNLKYSLDYSKIEDYIINNFIENAGVNQLLKVIKRISEGGFSFDKFDDKTNLNINELIIQPIIIYSDNALDIDGLNYILNIHFREKIQQLKYNFEIRELIIINIDFFIRYQDLLFNKKLNFNNLIFSYFNHIKKIQKYSGPNDKVNSLEFITFSEYVDSYRRINKIEFLLPKIFMNISKEVFNVKN